MALKRALTTAESQPAPITHISGEKLNSESSWNDIDPRQGEGAGLVPGHLADIENGVELERLDDLRQRGIEQKEIFALIVSQRTFKRRQSRGQRLSPEESERYYHLLHTLKRAESVYGDHDGALEWLRHPNKRLERRAPMEFLKTSVGADMVQQMLVQIDEGMIV